MWCGLESSIITSPITVLFLCVGNSSNSLIAETLLNGIGGGAFRAFSAGLDPLERPHPETLWLLERYGHSTTALRSKPMSEFFNQSPMDIVISLCSPNEEVYPIWPGNPMHAYWPVSDPIAVVDNAQRRQTFEQAYHFLKDKVNDLAKRERRGGLRLSVAQAAE